MCIELKWDSNIIKVRLFMIVLNLYTIHAILGVCIMPTGLRPA